LRLEIIDPVIAKHNGRIVKTTGDGLLLEFASVIDAVRCVIEVSNRDGREDFGRSPGSPNHIPCGVNIGDIIVDGDDIFGDGVNIAARLQEIAQPGGICTSGRVHDDIRDRLDTTFEDGGTQTTQEHRPAGPRCGVGLQVTRLRRHPCRRPPMCRWHSPTSRRSQCFRFRT
jgi:adenylate cyclase